jgi:hypothetical protein
VDAHDVAGDDAARLSIAGVHPHRLAASALLSWLTRPMSI